MSAGDDITAVREELDSGGSTDAIEAFERVVRRLHELEAQLREANVPPNAEASA